MKPVCFIVFFVSLLFNSNQSLCQQVVWKKILPFESIGKSISRTMEAGNFILGGYQSDNILPLIALYGNDGNNFWTSNICKSCSGYSVVFSKELKDGRILFVTSHAHIIITDRTGQNIDTTVILKTYLGNSEIIDKVLEFNSELIISSSHYYSSNSLYYLIFRHINTIDLKIISEEIKVKESSRIFVLAIMNDSSRIEGQSNLYGYTIRRLSASNQLIWEKNIIDKEFNFSDLIVTKDQRIFILGSKWVEESSIKQITSTTLLALNEHGDSLWKKTYSPNFSYSKGSFFNIYLRIKETREGDFILVGTKGIAFEGPTSWVHISKINTQGDLIWDHLESIGQVGGSEGTDFLIDDDQNIVVVGTGGLTDYTEPERAFIMKLSNPVITKKDSSSTILLLYPNPCNDNLTIKNKNQESIEKIELYNVDGKFLTSISINNNIYQLDTKYFASGIYLLKIFTLQDQVVRKLCKL